jgi:hypothetical protein
LSADSSSQNAGFKPILGTFFIFAASIDSPPLLLLLLLLQLLAIDWLVLDDLHSLPTLHSCDDRTGVNSSAFSTYPPNDRGESADCGLALVGALFFLFIDAAASSSSFVRGIAIACT